MDLAIILFFAGAAVVAWVFGWSWLHRNDAETIDLDQVIRDVPAATTHDALLVSREHGKLIYANEPARRWLNMNGGTPHIEHIARMAEPADSFLELFAQEGQSSFQLGQRWVEASSHLIPYEAETRTVVVMREISGAATHSDVLNISLAMGLINEIGETINAGMRTEQVLQTLLTMIGKAVSLDAGEICLWHPEEKVLYQRGWVGDARYSIALDEVGGMYKLGEGITGWVAQYRKPLLLEHRDDFSGVEPKLPDTPYQSFVAVPLKLGERFIGTLEIASKNAYRYSQADLALLQAIAKPAAVAIYNAEIFAKQVQRVDDLASLQRTVTQTDETKANTLAVYGALNERIARLMDAHMCGILIYDADRKSLVGQSPMFGIPDPVVERIRIQVSPDSPQYDIWANQPYWISNDLQDERLIDAMGLRPVVDTTGISNSVWMPLSISNQRIGMLVVSNKDGGFQQHDIQDMEVLATQAAIVIENVRLYQREQRMDTEREGLQEITDAIGTLTHETEFYGEITERIAKLMGIKICGILLYDQMSECLIAKPPFYGAADRQIEDYKIELKPGSAILELWEDNRYWVSNRVPTDPLMFEVGIDAILEALSIQKTMMAVLYASDRRLGVIQIADKNDSVDFNETDARLLMIFATQIAALIENARLFQQAQRSAEQAQGLRRVAEVAGGVMTSQDAFVPVLAEIATLTRSNIVFVNVLDQQTGSLVTYPRWVHGIELGEPMVQDIYSPGFEHSVSVSRRPFMSNSVQSSDRVIEGYRQISERFNIRNAVVVPLIFGDKTLGELGIANRLEEPYEQTDMEVMLSIAAQIAAALDRLLVYQERGDNLNRRMEELDAISRVSNELTLTLDIEQVLEVIREEMLKATHADDSTVVLLKAQDEWKNPNIPEVFKRFGDLNAFGSLADIELEAIRRRAESVLITDYEFSTMQPVPSWARSAIAIAIKHEREVVGVLHLYHTEPSHFDERGAAFLVTMAAKASLGYGNFMRFQEQSTRSERLRRRVDQLNRIFELGHMFQSNTNPLSILDAIAYSVQQSVGFDNVLMTLVDDEAGVLRRVTHAGLPIEYFANTRDVTMSLETLDDLLQPEYRISESYFFPIEAFQKWVVSDIEVLSMAYDGKRSVAWGGSDRWRDGDMLLVTMHGAAGKLIGVMSLDRPYDNLRPERNMVEILEIFAHQAATTIENTRLYLASMRSAEQEAKLNEVMESVSSTLDISEVSRAIAEGILGLVQFSRMDVAVVLEDNQTFEVIQVAVQSEKSLDVTNQRRMGLKGSALEQAFVQGTDLMFEEGEPEIEMYEDLKFQSQMGEKVTLLLPLLTGGTCLGVLRLGSRQNNAEAFRQARDVLRRLAQLVASSIQNARLFDQAVNLQVQNRAVVESIQQGIIVLDNSGRIISVNRFMHDRMEWDTTDIADKDLFAYRPDMKDLLYENLNIVLEKGEPQERINQIMTNKDGSMLVSNFYIYPLRYGDSIRGAVILVEDVTERARLEQAMEARTNQLAALTDVSGRITSSLDREEVVQLALEEIGWLINYDGMTLWRRNGSYMVLEGAAGQVNPEANQKGVRYLFADYRLMEEVVSARHVVVVGGASSDLDSLPLHRHAESWMGVPLVNQGHVVGMIMLTNSQPDAYESKSDQNIALAFASQVAIALANADLFEQTFDRTNELGTLLEAANATAMTTQLDTVFHTVADLMFSALDMDDCAIMIWDEVDNQLEVQVDMNRYGDENRITPKGTLYDLAEYPAKYYVLKEREVLVIQRTDKEIPYPKELEELIKNGDHARMLVPLIVNEQARGLIQLEQSSDDKAITQQKVRLARALGTQVAVAIENARLNAETTAHFEESLMINDLSRAISSTLNLEDMIEVVGEQLPNVTASTEMYLALYDADTEQITFPLAVRDGERYYIPPRPLNDDEVSFVIRHRRLLSIGADYFSPDELRRSLGIRNGEGDIKSYMGVPLVAGDEVYGVLAVRDPERTRAFTVNEQRILNTVGSQLGAAIQNARLFSRIQNFAEELNMQVAERTYELEEERDRIDTLYQITSELARTLDMERLMPRALGMVSKAVGGQDGVIMQLDPITDQLYSRAVLNPNSLQASPDGENAVHPAEKLARWLIEADEPARLVDDLYEEDFWDETAPGAAPWRSALAVLLETNEELLGVMVVLSRNENAFVESHLRLMVAAANQVASSINNAELYKLIRDQAERLGALLRAEQEETEKNKAILEGIADGVVLSDAEGKIVVFNTAAERILRIPREEAMNKSLTKLTGLYGTSATNWKRLMENRYAKFEDNVDFIDERLVLEGRTVSVHLSPVYTGEKFLGTVSVFRDITREVEADRSKSEFVSRVSHEFRTPLTSIKGYADFMLMGAAGEFTEMQTNLLETVRENTTRLTDLVEDVLNISKIDAGRERLEIGDVEVRAILDKIIEQIREKAERQHKDITLTLNAPESFPIIQGDREKIIRIFSNVLDNAYSYTRPGGAIRVEMSEVTGKENILVTVEDTGVGIPEEFQADIWKRFERHEPTALQLDVAGTGLGLPIVKELIEMHGGEIWFESEVDKGTIFYVSLPITQPEYLKNTPEITAEQ